MPPADIVTLERVLNVYPDWKSRGDGRRCGRAQSELFPWFIPILATGAICFTIGAIGFAMGSIKSNALSERIAKLVAAALIVMAAARFIPLGAAQIVIGVAGIVAFWPVAFEMWKHHGRE